MPGAVLRALVARAHTAACGKCGQCARPERRLSTCNRDFATSVPATPWDFEKRSIFSVDRKTFYFDTHAVVQVLEAKGFTVQQSEIIASSLVKIINTNMDLFYHDLITKMQQEISLQQVLSHIASVKKDMIILEKSEFSALRTQNEKVNIELQQLKKQLIDEIVKVQANNKLDFNLDKSEVKEKHNQEDRALTQTKRKLDTEVAGLKTMLESHKLDTIKYLAGSVFTCLTVAVGFYRLWM
uniref:Mitochondrial calcium uniporter regulator 1 n=1 Tax=Leptobrachium leishanense TaxID=445787 RepID=A0A8C5PVI3_9ANUR